MRPTACFLALVALAGAADAQTYNRQQSNARPLGLDVVDLVQTRGTDAKSADFLANELPDLTEFIRNGFDETSVFNGRQMQAVDPTNLRLVTDVDARAYFVSEGAGYKNSLGFNVDANGVTGGDPRLIFPDASSRDEFYDPRRPARRNRNNPIAAGDFVDLGRFTAGQTLDFFMIANGAGGGTNVYGPRAGDNPDGANHTLAFTFAVPDSPYLILGFEDLFGGGDGDFNDLVFAVDVGGATVSRLVSAPEPGVLFAMGSLGVAAVVRRRRAAV